MAMLKVKITGIRPLLMNADTLSDPLHPKTKAHKLLTAKRKKTDENHEEIARSSWEACMYHDEKLGPFMPGNNFEATLINAAKLSKLGTTFKRAVEVLEFKCPLEYSGPRDFDGLWNKGFVDGRSVKQQQAKIIRYRPRFEEWSFTCTIKYNSDTVDRGTLLKVIEDAGEQIGICDYRPKYGRFTSEVIDG